MLQSTRKKVLFVTDQDQASNGRIPQLVKAAGHAHNVYCFHITAGAKGKEQSGDDGTKLVEGVAHFSCACPTGSNKAVGNTLNKALEHQTRRWGNSFDLVHLDGSSPAIRSIALGGALKATPKLLSLERDPLDGRPHGSAQATMNEAVQHVGQWFQQIAPTYFLPANGQLKQQLLEQYGVPAERTRVVPAMTCSQGTDSWLADLYTETLATCGKLPEGRPYRQCTKCVLDTKDDPFIQFDDEGVCTYCHMYHRNDPRKMFHGKDKQKELEKIVDEIKRSRTHGKYDCIAGVSGGADSSYVALKLKEFGLTPLLVHLDNGYNSDLSNNNVKKIVEHLGFDLHHHTVDWEEFKNIQLAFLRASVLDIEMVTDHAMAAYIYNLADKMGIKYIIFGNNYVTEGILPNGWNHEKMDLLNIKAIAKEFGGMRKLTMPQLSFWRRPYLYLVKGIRGISLLNYLDYDHRQAKLEIMAKLGWTDYGAKHTESIFTRFYQNYILPTKFGIDKRKAHLATLIASDQLDRNSALAELKKDAYTPEGLRTDLEFVIGKLGITEKEFNDFMKAPIRQHTEFPSYTTRHFLMEKAFFIRVRPLTRLIKGRKDKA
jgi:N-acetyl sugar amidotransferase